LGKKLKRMDFDLDRKKESPNPNPKGKEGQRGGDLPSPAALTVVGLRTPHKENIMKRKEPNPIRQSNPNPKESE
jgi:hypothetical protein